MRTSVVLRALALFGVLVVLQMVVMNRASGTDSDASEQAATLADSQGRTDTRRPPAKAAADLRDERVPSKKVSIKQAPPTDTDEDRDDAGQGAAQARRIAMLRAARESAYKKRNATLEMVLHGKQKGWDKEVFSYDIYEPTYHCGLEERVGGDGDGAKWICGPRALREKCIIYSFGSNGIFQFEEEMLSINPTCVVHVFDPMPNVAKKMKSIVLPAGMEFHDYGLVEQGGPATVTMEGVEVRLLSLPQIMEELGHAFVDVLKIDVEGYEWEALDTEHLPPGSLAKVGQLQIELHLCNEQMSIFKRKAPTRTEYFIQWMQKLDKEGFEVFHKEPNLFAMCCFEYAWVNTRHFRLGDW